MALNCTAAQNLSAMIQKEFRDAGYSIPYNISQSE
jgi:hypothetical protein